jgi:hypothetical protein
LLKRYNAPRAARGALFFPRPTPFAENGKSLYD